MDLFKRYVVDAEDVQYEYERLKEFINENIGEFERELANSDNMQHFYFCLKIAELQDENKQLRHECNDFEERLKEIERTLSKFDRY